MNQLISYYEMCKKNIPGLHMKIGTHIVTVTIDEQFIFSTQGPNSVDVAEAFFMGMVHGYNIGKQKS